MFVCMAASGWLFARIVVLVVDDAGVRAFGVDIPIAAAVLGLWIWIVVGLFHPPPDVIARPQHTTSDGPLVITSMGRGMRFWHVVSVPICGLFIGLLSLAFVLPEPSPDDDSAPTEVWGIVAVAAFIVYLLALFWMISRAILHGAELTESELIVHGFFRTRKYHRDLVEGAKGEKLRFVAEYILNATELRFERTVRLTFRDGRQRVLYASSGGGVDRGAAVINEWLAEPRATLPPGDK